MLDENNKKVRTSVTLTVYDSSMITAAAKDIIFQVLVRRCLIFCTVYNFIFTEQQANGKVREGLDGKTVIPS